LDTFPAQSAESGLGIVVALLHDAFSEGVIVRTFSPMTGARSNDCF
jgi:hypothetical protein